MFITNTYKNYIHYEFKFEDGYIATTCNQPTIPRNEFIDKIKAHGKYLGRRRWKYNYIGSGYYEKYYF